jgi:hypothetical protein
VTATRARFSSHQASPPTRCHSKGNREADLGQGGGAAEAPRLNRSLVPGSSSSGTGGSGRCRYAMRMIPEWLLGRGRWARRLRVLGGVLMLLLIAGVLFEKTRRRARHPSLSSPAHAHRRRRRTSHVSGLSGTGIVRRDPRGRTLEGGSAAFPWRPGVRQRGTSARDPSRRGRLPTIAASACVSRRLEAHRLAAARPGSPPGARAGGWPLRDGAGGTAWAVGDPLTAEEGTGAAAWAAIPEGAHPTNVAATRAIQECGVGMGELLAFIDSPFDVDAGEQDVAAWGATRAVLHTTAPRGDQTPITGSVAAQMSLALSGESSSARRCCGGGVSSTPRRLSWGSGAGPAGSRSRPPGRCPRRCGCW